MTHRADQPPADDAAARPGTPDELVHVALGSNLGDRAGHLALAVAALAQHPRCRLVGATVPEETDPIGPAGQPRYLNQMLALTTDLSPLELLDLLQDVERRAGRRRGERWGPRTLDADVVQFGARHIAHPRLVVPHPELPRRTFWRGELAALGAAAGRGLS